jgi:hypothetical protein
VVAARVQRDDRALREPRFRDISVGTINGRGQVVLADDVLAIENGARP